MRVRWSALALAGAAVLAACSGHRRADPDRLVRLESVAIVARVKGGPSVMAAQVAPELANPPGTPGEESDKRLARQLAAQMRRYEIGERIRAELTRRLPSEPPWSRALPAVEVATALESLLVEDRASEIDYQALRRRGADSVLEIVVEDFGVTHSGGRTGLYWKAQGRLVDLDGGSVVWRAPLSHDETSVAESEPRDVAELRDEGFREAVLEMVEWIADAAARDLAPGRPEARTGTSEDAAE